MAEILGTGGNDDGVDNPALTGTPGDDVIAGFTGSDLIQGLGGDDFLSPGFGTDTVRGGDGDDRVLLPGGGVNERDVLDGGEGFDRLILDAGSGPAPVPIVNSDVTGFERIDLNENLLLLRSWQLDGIQQVTGFGRTGLLNIRDDRDVTLGGIAVGEGGTAMGRLVSFEAGGPQRIDASGATAAWEIATLGNGDTLLGGAGDDILRHERSEFAGAPRSLVDGGPGRDIFRSGDPGRYDMDFSGIDFRNVEVFEGSGKFRPAQIAGFEELRGIGTIEIVSGGRVDLTGKVTSAAFTRFDTGAPFLTVLGPTGPLDVTMTDPRFQFTLVTGPGVDTVTTGAGNDLIRHWWTADWSTGDRIDTGDGNDTVNTGRGDDVIVTWATEADGNDLVFGGEGNDSISTGPGNDRVFGYSTVQNDRDTGNDTIDAGPGADFVIGAGGDDILIGGPDEGDLADVLNGNGGNDLIRGGAGNDSALGGDGADTLDGGFGSDTLIGHAGDDLITGGPGSDLIFGGPGDDFINGGFGSDRINGGAGADRFFHALDPGHGSDWIQDFAAEDVLVAPNGSSAADFQVNRANTPGAGAADIDEAFVIYRPTGQILWALVDGAALPAITLRIDEVPFDLLA